MNQVMEGKATLLEGEPPGEPCHMARQEPRLPLLPPPGRERGQGIRVIILSP